MNQLQATPSRTVEENFSRVMLEVFERFFADDRDPRKILGIAPGAEKRPAAVKAAFERLSRNCYAGNFPEGSAKMAKEARNILETAYHLLTHPRPSREWPKVSSITGQGVADLLAAVRNPKKQLISLLAQQFSHVSLSKLTGLTFENSIPKTKTNASSNRYNRTGQIISLLRGLV